MFIFSSGLTNMPLAMAGCVKINNGQTPENDAPQEFVDEMDERGHVESLFCACDFAFLNLMLFKNISRYFGPYLYRYLFTLFGLLKQILVKPLAFLVSKEFTTRPLRSLGSFSFQKSHGLQFLCPKRGCPKPEENLRNT